jgi:hypothetical protein
MRASKGPWFESIILILMAERAVRGSGCQLGSLGQTPGTQILGLLNTRGHGIPGGF